MGQSFARERDSVKYNWKVQKYGVAAWMNTSDSHIDTVGSRVTKKPQRTNTRTSKTPTHKTVTADVVTRYPHGTTVPPL